MLPIALSKPITAYNEATTSPPMNWLVDPAPAIRFCSNADSILFAPTLRLIPRSKAVTSFILFCLGVRTARQTHGKDRALARPPFQRASVALEHRHPAWPRASRT